MATYSACELAFAAGYRVRRVPSGGVTERVFDQAGDDRLLEIGPLATVADVVAFAGPRLDLPPDTAINGLGLPPLSAGNAAFHDHAHH